MRDVWQLLQIEPTQDARAIKSAYARLLRSTRPDDDAAAYQALREAYDRALGWAKGRAVEPAPALESEAQGESVDTRHWEASSEEESPTDDAEPDAADAPYWLARTPEPEPEPDSEPDSASTWDPLPDATPLEPARSSAPLLEHIRSTYTTPAELVAHAREAFRSGGYAALSELWDRLEQGLDRLPLEAGARASSAFASWVLEEPALPSPLLLRLQERFHWSDDFRATAALPRALALQLTARIALARSLPDDEALRWNTVLLKRLRLGTGWRGRLRLAGLNVLARRDWRAFREPQFADMLAVAGANASEQAALISAARAGGRLRLSAAFAFAFVLGALLMGGGEGVGKRLFMGLFFGGACFAGYLVAQLVGRFMLWLLDGLSQRMPEKLRDYRGLTLVADGCVMILALFAAILATLPATAPLARVMTGVWARLPGALAVLAGMCWLFAHRSEVLLGPAAFSFALRIWSEPMRVEHQPGAAGFMALAWLGAAGLALEGLVLAYHRDGHRLRGPHTNAKVFALAVAALAAPMTLVLLLLAPALPTELYRKHGPVAGYAPFCVPFALAPFLEKQPVIVTFSLAAASLSLFGALELMTRTARRMMR